MSRRCAVRFRGAGRGRVNVGQEKEQDAQNDVNRQKLRAFEPVRFAVARDLCGDANGHNKSRDFGDRKFQVHRAPERIGSEQQNRRHKQRDLNARTNRNANG